MQCRSLHAPRLTNLILGLAALLLGHPPTTADGFKIIGAGACRTGTASLAKALNLLSYNVYHGGSFHIFFDSSHTDRWFDVLRAKSPDPLYKLADDMTAFGFTATMDDPFAGFALPLSEYYPDAKVILTTHRDSESWFRSKFLNGRRVILQTYPPFARIHKYTMDMFEAYYHDQGCSAYPLLGDRAACIAAYERHNAAVRARVPAERLLDFQVWQGWQPLCRFLNVSVPPFPFPRRNADTNLRTEIRFMKEIVTRHAQTVGMPARRAWRRLQNRTAAVAKNRSAGSAGLWPTCQNVGRSCWTAKHYD